MGGNLVALPWFAVTTAPKHETSSAFRLAQKGFTSFVPVYRSARQWSDRTRFLDLPLIPGYAFCRFSPHQRAMVLATPGVMSVVSFGSGPAPIPNSEIESLILAARSGLKTEPWPDLPAGCAVRITSGPLQGARGSFLERAGARLIISVTLLNRSVSVQVDPAWVARDDRGPVRSQAAHSGRAAA